MDNPDPLPAQNRRAVLLSSTAPLPAFAVIPKTCELTGLSRSRLYELIGAGAVRAVKAGTRTLVDIASVVAYLHALPPAQVRPPRGFVASGMGSGC